MNRRELVNAIAAHTGQNNKDVEATLTGFTDVVQAVAAKGEPVIISGFAKFVRRDSPARMGRNPATGEAIKIKASKKARITPLKGFKDAVMIPGAAPKLGAGVWPPAPKAPAKKAPAKKAPAKKAPAKKASAKKAPARKAAPAAKKKAPAKKARITPLKGFKDAVMIPGAAPKLGAGVWPPAPKAPAKKAPAKKAPAKKAPAKKAPARKAAPAAKKKAPAKKAAAKRR